MPKRKHNPDFQPLRSRDREIRAESPVSWWLDVKREDWQQSVEEQALRLALSPMGQRGGSKETY